MTDIRNFAISDIGMYLYSYWKISQIKFVDTENQKQTFFVEDKYINHLASHRLSNVSSD